MNCENEITVEIPLKIEELKELFKNKNFKIMEEYDLNDIYMIHKNDIDKEYLDMLRNYVLIRHIIENKKETKLITHKYKKYNDKNEIVKQSKINCSINSINDAKKLLEALEYKERIRINAHLIVYSNGKDEIAIQNVNNKHIYLEIEQKCNYIDKTYRDIEEMKQVIKKYNIPIKNENYFVNKAEIEMKEQIIN